MSGKEDKIEEEEEEAKVVHHWSHEHRLTLGEPRIGDECSGCGRLFSGEEKAYVCRCRNYIVLDEECVGLPRNIRHTMHPQHILTQHVLNYDANDMLVLPIGKLCVICERTFNNTLGHHFYECTRAECKLCMHVRCAQGSDMMYDAADDGDDEQHRTIDHRSHPKHGLKLVRRSCRFKCDACGITRGGKSYMCCKANCQYWIHESCASLPQTIESNYVVHLKCAFNITRRYEKGILKFPISDMGEELIGGFIKREGGAISIPHDDEDYEFHNHKLRLVSPSPKEEENCDDGKDQESELICDGCITPIFSRKQRPSSSSSSSSKDYYYMSCNSGCNYNLHIECFHLPSRLLSIPLHHVSGHRLILKSPHECPDMEWECVVCSLTSSGLFYACTECNFVADIKCASLPATIYHRAHPQHPLHFQSGGGRIYCDAMCGDYIYSSNCYACGSCEFIVDVRCAMLPASITSRRWDKHHPLLLTYHANLNHRGEFYCDVCEIEMNPKRWMYHCRHCDLSIHPGCLKSTSGDHRNIKFGKEYVINDAAVHPPHPLTYQLLTKRRCDLCHEDMYEWQGFHCASCNFCVCLYCGLRCGVVCLEDGYMKGLRY